MYSKKKIFLEKFSESLGIITPACKAANIERKTYYRWLEKDEKFKKSVEEIKEEQIDIVESDFIDNIKGSGKVQLIGQIFYLKTRARHRGYQEKIENEHSGGLNINITRKIIGNDSDK